MIETTPPRGAFDYLLDPIRDQLQPPPRSPERDGGSGRQPIHREIIRLILFALLVWGIGLFALLAWGFFD